MMYACSRLRTQGSVSFPSRREALDGRLVKATVVGPVSSLGITNSRSCQRLRLATVALGDRQALTQGRVHARGGAVWRKQIDTSTGRFGGDFSRRSTAVDDVAALSQHVLQVTGGRR